MVTSISKHELHLEETWITQDCWFRLATTFLGITTTDTLLAFRATVAEGEEYKKIKILEFTDVLSFQMLTNTLDDNEVAPRRGGGHGAESEEEEQDPQLATPFPARHRLKAYGLKSAQPNPLFKKDSPYVKRCVMCSKANPKKNFKTSYYCAASTCGREIALCHDGTSSHERRCFEDHVNECAVAAGYMQIGSSSSKKRRTI